jgi:F0F1-type ATP synthase alpha subunit
MESLLKKNRILFKDLGIVDSISDGIVNIKGLNDVAYGEMVVICTSMVDVIGIVLNLDENNVSAIILNNEIEIKPGHML